MKTHLIVLFLLTSITGTSIKKGLYQDHGLKIILIEYKWDKMATAFSFPDTSSIITIPNQYFGSKSIPNLFYIEQIKDSASIDIVFSTDLAPTVGTCKNIPKQHVCVSRNTPIFFRHKNIDIKTDYCLIFLGYKQ